MEFIGIGVRKHIDFCVRKSCSVSYFPQPYNYAFPTRISTENSFAPYSNNPPALTA